jgi:pimeloyl-ACP methyl ester carboxylesterase
MPPHTRLIVRGTESRIHCIVSAGTGPETLFLNGAFSTRRDWKNVLRFLSPDFHTVTFDARGRGRSPSSANYSFAGALDDVASVVEATGLKRPILVGWSHGATLALRHAATHPGSIAGVVLVDGAFPVKVFHEQAKKRIRRQYRLLRAPMAVLGSLGILSRLSHHQAANLVLELDEIDAGLLPDYRSLDCPALIISGSGPHPGSPAEEMKFMRDAADTACDANTNVRLFGVVGSNHLQILRKHADVVAAAIETLAGPN